MQQLLLNLAYWVGATAYELGSQFVQSGFKLPL
jgi:hypothetical protein